MKSPQLSAVVNLLKQPSAPRRGSRGRVCDNHLICLFNHRESGRAALDTSPIRRMDTPVQGVRPGQKWGGGGEWGASPRRYSAGGPHAQINTRNHPDDNGCRFTRLIHTLLSSHSHNHTIKAEAVGWGVGVGVGGICDGGGSSQVHEMCEYVREMN